MEFRIQSTSIQGTHAFATILADYILSGRIPGRVPLLLKADLSPVDESFPEILPDTLPDNESIKRFNGNIGLVGPLGAGKTEFMRGFVRACGVSGDVVSPTFVLESVYDIPQSTSPEDRIGGPRVLGGGFARICHWDLYRLQPGETELELREQLLDPTTLVVVEWAEKIPWVGAFLDFTITIDYVLNSSKDQIEGERTIHVRGLPYSTTSDSSGWSHADVSILE